MWTKICQKKIMSPKTKHKAEKDLKGWPNHWPPPYKFLGPLIFNITSLNFSSSLTERQTIIRFKNQYGVRISENLLHEGLFLVAILRFYGPDDGYYDLVDHSDLDWYFTGNEVFSLSERVARWERPPDFPQTGPAK